MSKPDELPDNLKPLAARNAAFARANVRVGMAIAGDDERPTMNDRDFFGELFGGGKR